MIILLFISSPIILFFFQKNLTFPAIKFLHLAHTVINDFFAKKGGEAMLWFIVAGVLVGYVSARMAYCWESGTLAHIAIGIVGAYMGTTVFRFVGISSDGALGMIVIGSLGASCALWLLRVIYENSDF